MSVRRYQVSMDGDSALPRDAVVNTLYFNHTAEGSGLTQTDIDAICHDLAVVYDENWCGSGQRKITVKAYEVGGAPPHFPVGSATLNAGVAPPQAGVPREVALCLSFRASLNVPRRRGRIFLPVFTCGTAGPVQQLMQARPNQTLRDRAAAMGTHFGDIGGIDVDWSVYSQADAAPFAVAQAWVDDEWDTQRRRGLRPTTRSVVALSE